MFSLALIPTAILSFCASLSLAVPTLTIKGPDFVNAATGERFQLVGVAYQPGGSSGYSPSSGVDPLSDGAVCLRDAALMQRLGVNAIRVYNVDPTLNHDECASIFNSVGIYMLLDINSPLVGESIDRNAPWTSYDSTYLSRTFGVVEAFKNYPNTLLFFAGNEVINDDATGKTVPPYMRAVVRDLKNYIAKNSARAIPVGYSAADVRDILLDTWNYLQCTTTGDNTDPARADLFALNSYSWCGESSFSTSGYDGLASDFEHTSVPVFFSEYGCNVPYPRVFTEVQALYGPQMVNILSGGMVYEFSQEASNYGLVNINSDGSAKLLADFDTLQKRFASLDMATVQGTKAQNTSVVAPTCASSLISSSTFNKDFTIPAVPPGVQSLIDNGISKPNQGKIVSVTNTKVTHKVLNADGSVLSGLEIKVIAGDVVNTPLADKSSDADEISSATTAASNSTVAASSTAAPSSAATSIVIAPSGTAAASSASPIAASSATASSSSPSATSSITADSKSENSAGKSQIGFGALAALAVVAVYFA